MGLPFFLVWCPVWFGSRPGFFYFVQELEFFN
nr:MAG TPA: hypothetical protein [Caudoviricetes sp.]